MEYHDEKQHYSEFHPSDEEIALCTQDYEILSESSRADDDKSDADEEKTTQTLFTVDQPDPYIGKVILGRYEVQHLIGVGGMGRVYKAHQSTVDRHVALKILPAGPGMDEQLGPRFHQEALATSRLSHPNTITVHDFGQMEDGSLFIAMEYLTGRTLEDVIAERPNVSRALRIGLQICGSLAEAHENGIVHRDLKPANIIVSAIGNDKDWVKVVDFGIAKFVNAKSSFSASGTVSGTPEYMSPEQVKGLMVDSRSDIYSLGLLIYEMLTGRPVVQAKTALACMYAHINNTPRPFSRVRPKMAAPAGLEEVVLKMLAKEPQDRFQSIAELMPVLSELLLDEVTRNKSSSSREISDSHPHLPEEVLTPAEKSVNEQEEPPNELKILEDLAQVYEERGEPRQATDTYRKIATRLMDDGAYEDATRALMAALALSPNDEASRRMIETCFVILDERKTKAATKQALRTDGSRTGVSHVASPKRRPTKRRSVMRDRSMSDTTEKQVLETRLDFTVQDGHYRQALSLIRKRLSEEPNNSTAIEYAGRIYERVSEDDLDQDELTWLKALLGKATDTGSKKPSYLGINTHEEEHHLISIDGGKLVSAFGGEYQVAPFALQKFPVTNADYRDYICATGELAPAHWLGNEPPANALEAPVVGVSLEDARKYAKWRDMRLPTTVEWEAAARLPDGRRFPWGEDWNPENCHCFENGAAGPLTVGKYKGGASASGCLDLMGNVWEWTENHEETSAPEPGYFWVMGGSFRHACVKNDQIARTDVSEHGAYPYLGFRCARDLERTPK